MLPLGERTAVFGRVVLAMYVGLVVGPLVGGALTNSRTLTPLAVLYVAAGCFGTKRYPTGI